MIRKSLVIVFVLCLVSAPVVGPAVAGVSDTASVQEPDPPAGMVGIPSENIQDLRGDAAQDASNVSVGDLEGAVYTSRHAGSTDVSIVTPDQASAVAAGESPSEAAQEAVCSSPAAGKNPQFDCEPPESYGLVLTDDEYTEGREVAIRSGVVEASLGYLPSKLTIQNNETGETWTSPASVEDGWLTADVEHFSSNAVTWSGEVDISMTGATNGSSSTYGVSDYDSVSGFNAEFIGHTNSEYDNFTASGISSSGEVSADVGGNTQATDGEGGAPVVAVTGHSEPYSIESGTVTENTTTQDYGRHNGIALSPDGETLLLVSRQDGEIYQYSLSTPFDTSTRSQTASLSVDAKAEGATFVDNGTKLYTTGYDQKNVTSYTLSTPYDISTATQANSLDYSDLGGTYYKVYSLALGDGGKKLVLGDGGTVHQYTLSTAGDLSTAIYDGNASASSDTVAFDDNGHLYASNRDSPVLREYDLGTNYDITSGLTEVANHSLAADFVYGATFADAGDRLFYAGYYDTSPGSESAVWGEDVREPISSLTLSTSQDTVSYGSFTDGETKTKAVDLALGSDTLNFSADVGTLDVSATVLERTQTDGAQLTVNNNTTTATGQLADGETVDVTPPSSWIQEGQNTVTVELPSLDADSPPMQASLAYNHTAKDSQSVVYNDTTWTESYNVSKTYGGERQQASLTIPFEGTVVDIHSLEYAVNGSSWSTVSDSAYSLDQTTLTVDLRTIYGSDIPANTTFDVRTDGRKVQVSGGNITVLEPTGITASRLDTRIEVHDSPSDTTLNIQTGDTRFGSRIHYAYNQSWADPAEYTTITSSEQTLRLPNAETSDTARISTIPVTVTPETSGGDVEVVVDDPQTTEPVFEVKPGSSTGDDITYTYVTAKDDTDYVLYSETDGVILDSGTASSPLSLTGRDDAGIIQFLIDDTDTSSSGSDSTGVLGPLQDAPSPAETVLNFDFSNIWLVVLAAGGVALTGFVYYRDGEDAIADAGRGTASGTRRAATWVATSIRDTAVWTASGLTSAASWFASHPYITAGVVGLGSIAAVVTGVITLPEGAGVFILVTGTPAVAYVVLVRRLGVSQLVWAAITGVAVILGFQLLGTDVFGVLAASQAFPILAAGGVYLAYQALQTYRADASTPEEKNVIEFNADDGENGGGGS